MLLFDRKTHPMNGYNHELENIISYMFSLPQSSIVLIQFIAFKANSTFELFIDDLDIPNNEDHARVRAF